MPCGKLCSATQTGLNSVSEIRKLGKSIFRGDLCVVTLSYAIAGMLCCFNLSFRASLKICSCDVPSIAAIIRID